MVICPRFRDFWQAGEEIYPGTVFAQGGEKRRLRPRHITS